MSAPAYQLVRLRNGVVSVRSVTDGETFHPGIGPEAEAEGLYVRQLRLPERLAAVEGDLVLWDVGLGAGANALTAVRQMGEALAVSPSTTPRQVHLISFDRTDAALRFARAHAAQLGYLNGFLPLVDELLIAHRVSFSHGLLTVNWSLVLDDFPTLVGTPASSGLPPPHAILYDPHSPRATPAMWTVPLFASLHRRLDPHRPCALATFSRSTAARAALLLGGFYVGVGHATGLKEETTVAATGLALLAEPLGHRWLERARRSDSAEPLWTPTYRRERLREETWDRLRNHPQFADAPAECRSEGVSSSRSTDPARRPGS
jgi:tRNA U34 5-methylaminomethyl-2-thiouridine-forming methyltransferase MnmC